MGLTDWARKNLPPDANAAGIIAAVGPERAMEAAKQESAEIQARVRARIKSGQMAGPPYEGLPRSVRRTRSRRSRRAVTGRCRRPDGRFRRC